MGHAKTVKNAAPGMREKIFHPQSRKADQIARSNLRKDKMSAAASIRRKRDAAQGVSLLVPTHPQTLKHHAQSTSTPSSSTRSRRRARSPCPSCTPS
jgi:hypothetical protein